MISIIVPVYNRVKEIRQCIGSVLAQTFDDFELIIVDDHSTDSLKLVLNEYRDKRLKYLDVIEGRGVSVARNLGLKKAQGEKIIFLDADDYWEKQLLEILNTNMEQERADIVIGGFVIEDKNKQVIKTSMKSNEIKRWNGIELLKSYAGTGFGNYCVWGRLIKKELLTNITFPVGVAMSEDRIFMTRVYARARNVLYVPDSLFHVVMHEDNSHIKGYCREKEWNEMQAYEEIYTYYMQVVQDKKARREACEMLFQCKVKILYRIARVNNDLSDVIQRIRKSCIKDAKTILIYGNVKSKIQLIGIIVSPNTFIRIYKWIMKHNRKMLPSQKYQ